MGRVQCEDALWLRAGMAGSIPVRPSRHATSSPERRVPDARVHLAREGSGTDGSRVSAAARIRPADPNFTQFQGVDPVEVHPSDLPAKSQAELNGPGGSPTSIPWPDLPMARTAVLGHDGAGHRHGDRAHRFRRSAHSCVRSAVVQTNYGGSTC